MKTAHNIQQIAWHLENNFIPPLSPKVQERALAMVQDFNNIGTESYLQTPIAPNVPISVAQMFEDLHIEIIE